MQRLSDCASLRDRPATHTCRRSPAEPKPIVEHLRVVEEKSAVVGGENQAQICRATRLRGLAQRVLDSVNLDGDDALAAFHAAAQQTLIRAKWPGFAVVVLPDQLRVTAARRSRRPEIA